MKAILNDTFQGSNWVAGPLTKCSFVYEGVHYDIAGYFRRSSVLSPFANLMCEACSCIPQEPDFRKHVMREVFSLEKRGSHGVLQGRRLGYLQVAEITTDSRLLRRKFKQLQAAHWNQKAKVVMLKSLTSSSKKMVVVEALNMKDVLSFCNNILMAYRTNRFGGKPTLWDFLRDVAHNLNRAKQGF